MLSIVTASKGRQEIFQRVVDSIWENAHDPYSIEHIVATDVNDSKSHVFMEEYIRKYPAYDIIHQKVRLPKCEECSKVAGRVITHYERRNIHRDYWNPIARQSRGNVVFGLTNDYIIKTKDFDRIILEAVSSHRREHRHSYFQVLLDDDEDTLLPENAKPFPYCSLVALTKEAVGILGGLVPEEIVFSGGDQYVQQIFSNTLFNSQIDLSSQIKCELVSHYNGTQAGADEVTSGKPIDNTDWSVVGAKQYDIALDYAIIKQIKWVKYKLQEKESFMKKATPVEIEKLTERLIDMSSNDTDKGSWWGKYVGAEA